MDSEISKRDRSQEARHSSIHEALTVPVRRHPDCAKDDCQTCLDDHMALEAYLQEKIGGCNDWLMQYRKWLDEEGIPAEVNGWASWQAFDEKYVLAFINAWCGSDEG